MSCGWLAKLSWLHPESAELRSRPRNGTERRARTTTVALAAAAQNGTSGAPSKGLSHPVSNLAFGRWLRHARPVVTRALSPSCTIHGTSRDDPLHAPRKGFDTSRCQSVSTTLAPSRFGPSLRRVMPLIESSSARNRAGSSGHTIVTEPPSPPAPFTFQPAARSDRRLDDCPSTIPHESGVEQRLSLGVVGHRFAICVDVPGDQGERPR